MTERVGTLPIKIDATSNGEFHPVPVDAGIRAAKRLAAARRAEYARRTGVPRRRFLAGLCGAATTLLTLDAAFAARGNAGGRFVLPEEPAFEPAAAGETLSGREFIFDIQTHLVNPVGAWRQRRNARIWAQAPASPPAGACVEAEPVGCLFIEQARALGLRPICIRKGVSCAGMREHYACCVDVGRVARLYPDIRFIIYHSGFEIGRREGPFDPAHAERGISSLVKSLIDNGIAPNSNVYAELGSTWRFLMRDPTAAAHALGQLLRHVGEDRVLWGTDSIWS